MSIFAGLLGAGMSFLGGRQQSRDLRRGQQAQQNFLREGREMFEQNTPITSTFMPGGARAFETRQALMGLGGDPNSAREAFNNYLGSSDYGFRMQSGQQGITGSRAARGLLNSGRTGAALTDFGQQLGSRYMDSYLDRLGQDSQMGMNAAGMYGNVITGNANQMAGAAMQGGQDQAGVTGSMYGGIGEGIGTAVGGWNAQRNNPATPQPAGGRLYNRFFGGGR